MTGTDRRADVPEALKPLVARIVRDAGPLDIWLFGSRARDEARAESDWDLLAVLPDDADDALLDPAFGMTRMIDDTDSLLQEVSRRFGVDLS